MANTLETPINQDVVSGNDNDAVNAALDLIGKTLTVRNERKEQWDAIQDMFELGFEVSNPKGTRRLESQMLFKAVLKTVSKMKALDVSLHAQNAPEINEKIVTDGLGTVLDEGGWDEALRDKFGGFYRMLMYGDAFIRVGADTKAKYPIKFQNTSLLSLYADPFAINMRSPTSEKDVDELLAVYIYSWDQGIKLYPELKEKGGAGRILRRQDFTDELEYTNQQQIELMSREVEIAHYYNRALKRYTIFAGAANTVILDQKDDEYPFMKDGDPYIPFIHLMCFPSSEGFYNYGIGHTLYKLANVTRQLMNMGVNYAFDNVDPIRIANLPKGKKSIFFNQFQSAEEARQQGRKGMVINEYGPSDQTRGGTTFEALTSEPLTTEWERLFNQLEQEIGSIGIMFKDVDRGGNITATQIIAEEESSDTFIKQILEQNAGEFKFVWELSIEMVKEYIKKTDKTMINTTVNYFEGDDVVTFKGINMGELSDELRERDYFVKVNSRSGAIPSNIMQQTQLSRVLPFLEPGTPAFNKARLKFMRLNDQDMDPADFAAPQQQPQPGEEGEAPVSPEIPSLDQPIQ